RAAMQPDEAAHEREAEPGALEHPVIGRARLEEGVAELGEMARRNADAGVVHGDHEPIALDRRADSHAAVRRREFHGVREKVYHDLPAGSLVGYEFLGNVDRRLNERDAALMRLEP